MCFRAGYVDQQNQAFGGELTVYSVGSVSGLSEAQIAMSFDDGTVLASSTGSLAASANLPAKRTV